ncbi:helicase HerA domain-containing protein, partial [Halobium palmae]
MSDEETITVAEISDGPGGASETPGESVDLPVVEILTGRGFVTGKSGSGKSNTASVVIENLLENNFPVLIVDTDGEYYGLKEAFEILHVGADEECDIQVSPEHSEKIASLALEQNVPIILDVSGYLDEADAEEMLLETARSLFAKEKKLKKPFLMLVEECHEYIPEKGGMGEAGKMLIKIGKRGRKHGLGIVGISQRPADVKKDYITQCDWLCWHRLTWNNDTKVVGRILGSEYADAIEDMGNGEAFLMTDWAESIRRVQFHRKETFDAGATPGLDDFERPELKSVSGDLVSELSDISDEKARRESEVADLRQELDKKRAKIDQLERELAEAKDLKRMADKFSQALLGRAEAPYRGRSQSTPGDQRELREYERGEVDPGEVVDAAAN